MFKIALGFVLGAGVMALIASAYPSANQRLVRQGLDTAATAASSGLSTSKTYLDKQLSEHN